MATKTSIQRRNIVVLGKTGAGKSTVANKIAGYDNFEVKNSAQSGTSKVSHTEFEMMDPKSNTRFDFRLIDTIGLFGIKQKRDADIMKEIKDYFHYNVPEGVNLVLFIFRKGRFTAEEKAAFDYIIKNFSGKIADISALVITSCENEDENGRQDLIKDFKESAPEIVKFMGKGVHPVGFPDTTNLMPALKDVYKEPVQQDANALRELAMKAGERRLFEMSWGEQVNQCVSM